MNSFQDRIHEQYVVSDAIADLIVGLGVDGFALSNGQLLLHLVI